MTTPGNPLHALLADIRDRKVCQDDPDRVWIDLGPDGSADVTQGAWSLYGIGLAEPGSSTDENGIAYWRLTERGVALLRAADPPLIDEGEGLLT